MEAENPMVPPIMRNRARTQFPGPTKAMQPEERTPTRVKRKSILFFDPFTSAAAPRIGAKKALRKRETAEAYAQ